MEKAKIYKKLKIKVSDLLLEVGKTDTIKFSNVKIDFFENLQENGISGQIYIESLDKKTIFARLENIKCGFEEICERCLEKFERKVEIQSYEAKFMINGVEQLLDDKVDEIYRINEDGYIDIIPMLTNSIQLQEPISLKCPICTKKIQEDLEKNPDNRDKSNRETENYLLSNEGVKFNYKNKKNDSGKSSNKKKYRN